MSTSPEEVSPKELTAQELLSWIEFCAWTSLVLTPIVWWLQGSSVSNDQFVVRSALVVISAVVAISLRALKLLGK